MEQYLISGSPGIPTILSQTFWNHSMWKMVSDILQLQGASNIANSNYNLSFIKSCLPPPPHLIRNNSTSFTQLDQNDQLISNSNNIFPLQPFQPSFQMNNTCRNNNLLTFSELILFKSQQRLNEFQTVLRISQWSHITQPLKPHLTKFHQS
jgi:hypothetical protein